MFALDATGQYSKNFKIAFPDVFFLPIYSSININLPGFHATDKGKLFICTSHYMSNGSMITFYINEFRQATKIYGLNGKLFQYSHRTETNFLIHIVGMYN